jgi:hypothetical protein
MDWKRCNEEKIVKRISVDKELAKSLIESAGNKFTSASLLKLSEVTSSSVVTLYYDSLREFLEALSVLKGYKIYNHECYTSFLKEIIEDEDFSREFDSVRKIRNSINYYGEKLGLNDAEIIVRDVKELIKKCKNLLNSGEDNGY